MNTIKMKCCCGAEFEWPYEESNIRGVYTNTREFAEQRADAWIDLHRLCPISKRSIEFKSWQKQNQKTEVEE